MVTPGDKVLQSRPIHFRWSLLVNLGGIYLPFIFVTPFLGAIRLGEWLILFVTCPGLGPAFFLRQLGIPDDALGFVAVIFSGLLVVAHAWFGKQNEISLTWSFISSIAIGSFGAYVAFSFYWYL